MNALLEHRSTRKTARPAPNGGQFENAIVEWVDPLATPDWDAWILTQPEFSFFHSTAWMRVLSDAYGFKPTCLTVRGRDRLRAALPMMEVDSLFSGRRGVSLPFSDFCPALGADRAPAGLLFRELVDEGKRRNWQYVECRGGPLPSLDARPSISYYGHELDLDADAARLFGRCSESARRAVRKAIREGVTVDIQSSQEALKAFYQLHCRTRRKHGVPPQPRKFFDQIHTHILRRNLGFIVLARKDQQPIAGAVFFCLASKALYKFGASDETMQRMRGNNLVMWEAIKHCRQRHLQSLHFGRTAEDNSGLRRWKRGWGGTESSIAYFKYDLKKNQFVTDTDHQPAFSRRAFKRMPLVVSRLIGAFLYRHMA